MWCGEVSQKFDVVDLVSQKLGVARRSIADIYNRSGEILPTFVQTPS
jgi:hypothetical protein